MNQEYKQKYKEDEINIRDYVEVIIKRKQLVLALFLVAVIGAGVYSFFIAKKNYKVETVLEIGTIGDSAKTIENIPQILTKIKNSFYGYYSGMEIFNPKDTNIVEIKIISKNPDKAKEALKNINKEILSDHNKKIDFHKKLLEKQKEEIDRNIKDLKKDISSLIFKNQQIVLLQLRVYQLQEKKDDLERKIESFRPTKIIKEPTISPKPLKPRPAFNIIIAGALGAFLGIIFVFLDEWWKKTGA